MKTSTTFTTTIRTCPHSPARRAERPLSPSRSACKNQHVMFPNFGPTKPCLLLFTLVPVLSMAACSGVTSASPATGGAGGTGGTGTQNLACNAMSAGQGASLNGFVPFTGSSAWNTDISSAPVDPNSASIISNWVGSVNVHPDFGSDPTYGIPYVVDRKSVV